MKNITTALFDFDGTLFDSMYIWETVGIRFLRSKGCEVGDDIFSKIKKLTLFGAAEFFQKEFNLDLTPEEIIKEIHAILAQAYFNEVMPKPYIRQVLDTLKSKGVALYVTTATDRFLIEGALKRTGLLDYFSEIYTCTEVGYSKNHLEYFETINKQLNFDKATTWLFDDAAHACATAKQYGINVCGVYEKAETEQAKLKANSDIYINSFNEILDILIK